MALPPFEKRYGPPNYGPRKGTRGVTFHSFEGNHTLTVEEARKGAAWQASAGNTSGGSYNLIMGPGFILETVPWANASGGMHPGTAIRDAQPWVRELMGPEAMSDPNAYVIQVCLWGRTGEFLRLGYPDALIQQGAELVRKIELDFGIDCVVTGHMHWQNDRSDPGQPYVDAVLARYQELYSGPPPVTTSDALTSPKTFTVKVKQTATPSERGLYGYKWDGKRWIGGWVRPEWTRLGSTHRVVRRVKATFANGKTDTLYQFPSGWYITTSAFGAPYVA